MMQIVYKDDLNISIAAQYPGYSTQRYIYQILGIFVTIIWLVDGKCDLHGSTLVLHYQTTQHLTVRDTQLTMCWMINTMCICLYQINNNNTKLQLSIVMFSLTDLDMNGNRLFCIDPHITNDIVVFVKFHVPYCTCDIQLVE